MHKRKVMKMRKKLFYVLIGIFIIQLFVPAFMITYSIVSERKIETLGTEYYLEVDPNFVTEDKEISFTIYSENKLNEASSDFDSHGYFYALIDNSSDGTAYLHDLSDEKPSSDNYIRSKMKRVWVFPESHYKVDESTAIAMDNYIYKNRNNDWYWGVSADKRKYDDTITVCIKVYKGKIIIKGMYINGTPIEEYFKNS